VSLPRDAYYATGELVPLLDENDQLNGKLAGRICCDQIVPYPPGIPVLVPGQRITAKYRRLPGALPPRAEQGRAAWRSSTRAMCVDPRVDGQRGAKAGAYPGAEAGAPSRRVARSTLRSRARWERTTSSAPDSAAGCAGTYDGDIESAKHRSCLGRAANVLSL